jgi:hypothetical protein
MGRNTTFLNSQNLRCGKEEKMGNEKEVKKLKEKLGLLESAIEKGFEEKARVRSREDEKMEKIKNFDSNMQELRRKRGILLASGENIDAVNKEIQKLAHEKELAEDEVAGLEHRIEDIGKEFRGLREEKITTENEIFRLHACLLIDYLNEVGQKYYAPKLRELWALLKAMGVPQDRGAPAGNNQLISCSNWGALVCIPKLYRPEDWDATGIGNKDIFKYDPRDYDQTKIRESLLK